MSRKIVHVVGTGTIGEPLIGLLCDFKDKLGIDEVTFHKNTPLTTDRSKVINLINNRGARLTTHEEKFDGFIDIGLKPDFNTEEAIDRASVVIDCTPKGFGHDNKHKYYEKYSKNTFYAVKVIFANQMYDICQAMGEDWAAIREIITAEQAQPIGPSHMDPIFGLNRGFGGKCLPKDSNALRVLAEELGVKYEWMDALQNDNDNLRNILTGKPSDVETQDD